MRKETFWVLAAADSYPSSLSIFNPWFGLNRMAVLKTTSQLLLAYTSKHPQLPNSFGWKWGFKKECWPLNVRALGHVKEWPELLHNRSQAVCDTHKIQ